MNHALDYCSVGLILASSLAYAAASLGPKSWRSRIYGVAGRALSVAPRWFGLGGLGSRLSAAAQKSGAACGGCDGCAPAAEAGKGAVAAKAGAEVKIPVGSIGRRAAH
jgi:hypothetical protein